jgi:hypothetical protein
MKQINYCLTILIALLFSCKTVKNQEPVTPNSKNIELHIYNSSWFTKTDKRPRNTYIEVNLAISGKTNAKKLTVKTFGDGHIGEFELKPDTNGMFSDTIQIRFCWDISNTEPTKIYNYETIVKAYTESETADTTLRSGPLQYYK